MSRFQQLEIIDEQGHYHVPDAHLLALAERIYTAYIELRPRYVPGRVVVPKSALIHFYRAAMRCTNQRLTPEVYVEQQLGGMAMTGSFWPGAIAKHFETQPAAVTSAVERYRSQLALYRARATLYGPSCTLQDEQAQLSPLFRYAMAKRLNNSQVMDCHRQAAVEEFKACAGAREVFSELEGDLGG